MKRRVLVLLAGVTAAAAAAPASPDAAAYLRQHGWTVTASSHAVANPVPGIVPLIYMAKGAVGPSCALLVDTGAAPALLELSSPGAEEGFPQCLAVDAAAQFTLEGRDYAVFEYLTRETREDTARQYYYVVRDGAGHYHPAARFNDAAETPPAAPVSYPGTDAARARDGVLFARTIATAATMPGMHLQGRDYLVDGARSFAIFQNAAKNACTFVVDDGVAANRFAHALFAGGDACSTILASGKLAVRGNTYYLALFTGAGKTHLGVVSVTSAGVVKPEAELAVAATRPGTPGTMKQAKSQLASVLK